MHRLSAPWLMVLATLLFAAMGVCVKYASAFYGTGVIVFFRGLVGALMMGVVVQLRRTSLRTRVPWMHAWRGVVGVSALALWFYAMGRLPLATAVTLNYMSSLWMAAYLLLRQWLRRGRQVEVMLFVPVLLGLAGVLLVLKPTFERDQWLEGLIGLASGLLAAGAYLQVKALGRVGEPVARVVFYFSLCGAVFGLAMMLLTGGWGQAPAISHAAQGGLARVLGVGALLGAGVFATSAQMLMTRAYARGSALVNASLQYLGIAHAFVLGVVLFHDPVTLAALVGMALIIGAGVMATRWSAAPEPEDVDLSD
jgi:S-adenosylmethionine uptake transporter